VSAIDAIPTLYVDSSVLVALLSVDDPQRAAARSWTADPRVRMLTSVLAEVEVERALARRNAPRSVHAAARRLLSRTHLVQVTSDIRKVAATVRPASTRSLDAVHVATAMLAEVQQFASLDVRQTVAAEEMGLQVLT
jgi:predicted nucleic acid-binding protein